MKSIRRGLLIWLLSGILFAGAIGAGVTYRNTLAEADQFFDYHLRQAALVLRDQAFEAAVPSEIAAAADEYDFVVQVWGPNGVLAYQSQQHATLPDLTALGFATANTDSGQWRTFGIASRGYVIQVAQPMQVRRAQAVQLALRTLLPFAIVMPVLALAVLFVVPKTLRPLRQLAEELTNRHATALHPIDVDELPNEVQPLVSAFNDMLHRLAGTLEREQAFIADAAHELRTPVTALRLQLEALKAAKDETERTEAKRRLEGGVARAGRLVEQLLSMARLRSHSQPLQSTVQLDDLVRELVAEKMTLADARHIDLGVTEAQPFSLQGDAFGLRMLLANLIDNAIHYSPQDGRVDVSLVVESNRGVLRVVDNGPGIPATERENVFRRFYRAVTDTSEGSGLGLAIAKSVAEQHNAILELADGPNGHGLVAIARFPGAEGKQP